MILLNLPSSAACGHRGYATSWRCWVWSFCAPCKFATLAVWLRQETEICTWSCFHPVFLWCFENPTPSGVQEFKIYYLCCLGTDHRPAASTLWRILSLSFLLSFLIRFGDVSWPGQLCVFKMFEERWWQSGNPLKFVHSSCVFHGSFKAQCDNSWWRRNWYISACIANPFWSVTIV